MNYKRCLVIVALVTGKPAASDSVDKWFSPCRFGILLALLIVATFPDVISGKTFFHRDFAVFGYPLAAHHRACLWRGEIPLWTPLSYCGLPFLAQWNTMTLYPFSFIYLLLPLSWSLGLFCLGHLFFAGMGMYFLAHGWTQNRVAASIAGLAFVFNAVLLHSLMWPNNIAGFAWMPWVVLAVECAWREGGRRIVLAALAGAMQMLAGAPEVILLTWLFLGALLLLEMWRDAALRAQMPWRFAGVVALVAGLAAAQLLPFLDLLRVSQRHGDFADSTWAMPLSGWANYFVPLFRTYLTSLGIYMQPSQLWIPSYYLGIGVAWLAVLAVLLVRSPRVWLLALLTLACLLIALGERGLVYGALRRVLPGLGFMRFPVKFIILPTFLIPLLAANAVAHCQSLNGDAWRRARPKLILLAVAFLVVIAVVGLAAVRFPKPGLVGAVGMSSALITAFILSLFVIAIIAWLRGASGRFALLRCFAIAGLVWMDAITNAPRPNPTVARWVYEPGLAARKSGLKPMPRAGESRMTLSEDAEGKLCVAQLTNSADTVMYYRTGFMCNENLLDDVPKVIGFYSLFTGKLGEVLPFLYSTNGLPAGLMDFLAVSHVNVPGKLTEWNFRPTHLPWVTAGQKPLFADAQTTLLAMSGRDFDPRCEVFLPEEARNQVAVLRTSSPKIVTREFSSHRLRLEAESAEPALIVVAQSYYHNWRAYVNGKPVPLLRANHAFQAIEIPTGRHDVMLRYEDRMFQFGAGISVLSLLACGVVWLADQKEKRGVSISPPLS